MAEAMAGVAVAQVAVSVLPFREAHKLSRQLRVAVAKTRALRSREAASARVLADAIERAGRHVPHARCLSRALAGSVIFARHGHDATLRIGVRRPGEDGFEAHAWLECEGEVVVGGPVDSFTPFPSFR